MSKAIYDHYVVGIHLHPSIHHHLDHDMILITKKGISVEFVKDFSSSLTIVSTLHDQPPEILIILWTSSGMSHDSRKTLAIRNWTFRGYLNSDTT